MKLPELPENPTREQIVEREGMYLELIEQLNLYIDELQAEINVFKEEKAAARRAAAKETLEKMGVAHLIDFQQ